MKIKVTNLGKRFNREWIFKNLSYEFKSGNTYAITGPNGSGKSTLLQILWGQVPPSEGIIEWEDKGVTILPEQIFEHLTIATPYMELVEEFTLKEMIAFHFKFKKIRNGGSTADILNKMELGHAADKTISNFSSGMRQRVKLALAMFSDTSILFLDEPTTNLDAKSAAWYQNLLKSLPRQILIFIASNQEHEYPSTAEKLDILTYKKVTTSRK